MYMSSRASALRAAREEAIRQQRERTINRVGAISRINREEATRIVDQANLIRDSARHYSQKPYLYKNIKTHIPTTKVRKTRHGGRRSKKSRRKIKKTF